MKFTFVKLIKKIRREGELSITLKKPSIIYILHSRNKRSYLFISLIDFPKLKKYCHSVLDLNIHFKFIKIRSLHQMDFITSNKCLFTIIITSLRKIKRNKLFSNHPTQQINIQNWFIYSLLANILHFMYNFIKTIKIYKLDYAIDII